MSHYPGNFNGKLPQVGTTIFTVMSKLAQESGAINLSQGFPDFDTYPELIDLVSHHMRNARNQYAPMVGAEALRSAIAEKTNRLYGAQYHVDNEITITAGATQAINVAISAFVHEKDEVIIIEPAYDSYVPCILLQKARPVYYKMKMPECSIDWKQVMKLINQKTSMIIINTPHNPTGSVLGGEDMQQLEKILHGTDIIVLSDEVYEHIVFDGGIHQSAVRFNNLRERTICVSSFGKTFHTTGWKVGYVLAPENLMAEFRKVFQFAMFSVATPMQYAFADFLKMEQYYLGLSDFYQKKRDLFRHYLANSRFKLLDAHGAYFQCVDYSEISLENDVAFAEKLTKEFKVAAIPVSAFYKSKDDDKIVRFCFAKQDDTLHKAGEILCRI